MRLPKMKISQKLPLLISCLAVLSAVTTGFITLTQASKEAMSAAEEKLVALQASRVSALQSYLGSIEQDLSSLSRNEYVRSALLDFRSAWNIENMMNPGVNRTEQSPGSCQYVDTDLQEPGDCADGCGSRVIFGIARAF